MGLNYNKCPCYTCLVAAVCPGKEPTPEEHDKMMEEIDNNPIFWDPPDFEDDFEDDFDFMEIPEVKAQQSCPEYIKWSGTDLKKEIEKIDKTWNESSVWWIGDEPSLQIKENKK